MTQILSSEEVMLAFSKQSFSGAFFVCGEDTSFDVSAAPFAATSVYV
jgi:hypothetical protein